MRSLGRGLCFPLGVESNNDVTVLRSTALAVAAISSLAQSIPDARNQDDLARAAKNPYDLARFIDSHLTLI
jgi:hypothetical protein